MNNTTMTKKRYTLLVVLILIIPLFLSAVLTNVLYRPEQKYNKMLAAFVNNDKPVTINGQLMPLGRQLGATLMSNTDENYVWEFTNNSDALDGLISGKYVVAITIPENFSETLTAISKNINNAQQANIQITSSPTSKIDDDAISQTLVNNARLAFNKQIQTTFLDNIFVGFNTLSKGIAEAANGGKKLVKGGKKLVDGSSLLENGTQSLYGGIDQLSNGTNSLTNGINQLSTATGKLSSGTKKLYSGSKSLYSGTSKLKTATKQLPSKKQVKEITTILNDVKTISSDVVNANSATVKQLTIDYNQKGCSTKTDNPECLLQKVVISTFGCVLYGGDSYFGLKCLSSTFKGIAYYNTIIKQYTAQLTQLFNGLPELKSAISQLNGGAKKLNSGIKTLNDSSKQLNNGTKTLKNGANQLNSGTSTLNGGAKKLLSSQKLFNSKLKEYTDGVNKIAKGLDGAKKQIPQIDDKNKSTIESVVASPISLSLAKNFSTSKNIAFIAIFVLWLCLSILFIFRSPVPNNILNSSKSPIILHIQNLIPSLIGGVAQAIAIGFGINLFVDLNKTRLIKFLILLSIIAITFILLMQVFYMIFGKLSHLFYVLITGIIVLVFTIGTTNQNVVKFFNMTPLYIGEGAIRRFFLNYASVRQSIILLAVCCLVCFIISNIFIRLKTHVNK